VIDFEASNLTLLLQGKVYEGYSCNSVTGHFGASSLNAIRSTVRSRILELTIQLESVLAPSIKTHGDPTQSKSDLHPSLPNQTIQQIIYGGHNVITAGSSGSSITVSVNSHDPKSLTDYLKAGGISPEDAEELTQIASVDTPGTITEPMGPKVNAWLVQNLHKAASGVWQAGLSVATEVVKQGLLKFYNLS